MGAGDAGGDASAPLLSGSGSKTADWKQYRIALAIFYYAMVSGPMLVINKVTVHFLPAPTFNLICQMAASAGFVFLADQAGLVKSEPLEWPKVRKFLSLILAFVGVIFCNMKTIQYANVETFITFRSSTPLVISLCDYVFLGRELPNARSWACLLAILSGSVGYVLTDAGFRVEVSASELFLLDGCRVHRRQTMASARFICSLRLSCYRVNPLRCMASARLASPA